PAVGRVLLLSVISGKDLDATRARLDSAQKSLGAALRNSMERGHTPEAMMTIASDPWSEIERVADSHGCESVLLGFSEVPKDASGSRLEGLLSKVESDIVVLRAPENWALEEVKRILVPIGGRGVHDSLRARLLGSIARQLKCEVTFLQVMPESAPQSELAETKVSLERLAAEEAKGRHRAEVITSTDVKAALVHAAAEHDLVVLGLQRVGRRRRIFGDLAIRIADETGTATVMISRR
ncbi:MAG: universal stress protein, partial [Myxococcales bacterium]|nr:universal stress protein [Myxococcales bacterium]